MSTSYEAPGNIQLSAWLHEMVKDAEHLSKMLWYAHMDYYGGRKPAVLLDTDMTDGNDERFWSARILSQVSPMLTENHSSEIHFDALAHSGAADDAMIREIQSMQRNSASAIEEPEFLGSGGTTSMLHHSIYRTGEERHRRGFGVKVSRYIGIATSQMLVWLGYHRRLYDALDVMSSTYTKLAHEGVTLRRNHHAQHMFRILVIRSLYDAIQHVTLQHDVPLAWQEPLLVQHVLHELSDRERMADMIVEIFEKFERKKMAILFPQ